MLLNKSPILGKKFTNVSDTAVCLWVFTLLVICCCSMESNMKNIRKWGALIVGVLHQFHSSFKCLLKSCCCHLVAGVKGVSGDAPSQLHLRVRPGDDVSPEVAATRRQAVDVTGRQHVWPHVQVRHLTHKRLSRVKTASQCILEESQPHSQWRWKVIYVQFTLCGRFLYLLLPQDEDPSRFDGMPGGEIQARTPLHTILVGLPLSITGGPGHAHVVPFSIADRQWQGHGLWAWQGR